MSTDHPQCAALSRDAVRLVRRARAILKQIEPSMRMSHVLMIERRANDPISGCGGLPYPVIRDSSEENLAEHRSERHG